jgi:hypothetical protein
MPRKDKSLNAADFRKWYANNKKVHQERVKQQKERNFKEICEYKESTPCADCGKNYPYYVMDFDHRDPATKKFTIASKAKSTSRKQIWEEIAKCDVVCSNCHRERTHGR